MLNTKYLSQGAMVFFLGRIPINPSVFSLLGSLSNDDGDGNANGKKAMGLDGKTTTLHVHHAYLYIS